MWLARAEGPGFLTRLLRAYSQGLFRAGYPTSYSGVAAQIDEVLPRPLDHGEPYSDPQQDHNHLQLKPPISP